MATVDKSSSKIICKACSVSIFFLVFIIAVRTANGQVYLGKNKSLSFDFSFTTAYDDNILKYSDSDLDQLDDPSVPQNKYGIKSQDDYIIMPEIDIVYKTKFVGHSLHLGIMTTYYYYVENDIKRYFRYQGRLRQYFRKGLYLQASLIYFPDYYYRNSYSTSYGYNEAQFDKISSEFKLAVPLFDSFRSNLYYTYSQKDFNPLFDERDLTSHEFKIETIYRPVAFWKGWASYEFCTATSAGADNPDFRRDTSYDAFLFILGSRFYLNGFSGRQLELAGSVSYKAVLFQTGKITSEDRYRLGREDDRWMVSFISKQMIVGNFSIGLDFKRVVNKVDLPASQLKEYLEYSSSSVYFILEYKL